VLVTESEHIAETKARLSAQGLRSVAESPRVFERLPH
jgi:hypothetical protein